jgi:hypothetical protein
MVAQQQWYGIDQLRDLLEDAYRVKAPAAALKELDERT